MGTPFVYLCARRTQNLIILGGKFLVNLKRRFYVVKEGTNAPHNIRHNVWSAGRAAAIRRRPSCTPDVAE
jgi:hypothetical protein